MSYNLPRGYLSYSAYHLWITNKNQFRERYYENKPAFETAETIFGKKVHKMLEDTRIGREKRMEATLPCGLKLLGYIDEFNEETLAIRDDKTGHLDAKGKPPWDAVKVARHKQLVFYSLLSLLNHGKYNRVVELQWIETRFKKKIVEFDGHVLESDSKELELTGKVKVFKRTVFKWEMLKLQDEITEAAKNISEDYTTWLSERNTVTE